jgi:alcohol dehydrogenase (cytochrome c)
MLSTLKTSAAPGKLWLGTKPEDIGKKVWQHNFPKSHLFGSVLATAGDLVFAGGTNDRNFRAFDAKTGQLLWGAEDQLRHHGDAGRL